MPLVINDQVLDFMPVDTHSLFDRFPQFKDMSSLLVSQVAKVVSPHGLLYIHQRELAVTVASDKHISIMGMTSDECLSRRFISLRFDTRNRKKNNSFFYSSRNGLHDNLSMCNHPSYGKWSRGLGPFRRQRHRGRHKQDDS